MALEVKQEIIVRVACVQMDLEIGQVKANTEKTLRLINDAADNGAQLIVLPELCVSGYVFRNREEAFACSETIPDGPSCQQWIQVCRERKVYVVAGASEIDGGRLYNSSVLLGPDGFIGKYRKVQLWADEFLWYEPGDTGIPVFKTPIGRIGMIICNDMWYQEFYRILAVQGADIICASVDGVWHEGLPNNMLTFFPIQCMAGANSNNVFVAVADRVGTERGVRFPGRSLIVANTGVPIVGPIDLQEEIIYADCDFAAVRRHQSNAYNSVIKDRRIDVYDEFLGYRKELYKQI
ncbi:MAG: nitrilase family protein [Clostridiaceae bacterium]